LLWLLTNVGQFKIVMVTRFIDAGKVGTYHCSCNHPEMVRYEEHLQEVICSGTRRQDPLILKIPVYEGIDDLAAGNTHIVAIILFRFGENMETSYAKQLYCHGLSKRNRIKSYDTPSFNYDELSDTLYVSFTPAKKRPGSNERPYFVADQQGGTPGHRDQFFEYSLLAQHTEIGPRSFR